MTNTKNYQCKIGYYIIWGREKIMVEFTNFFASLIITVRKNAVIYTIMILEVFI